MEQEQKTKTEGIKSSGAIQNIAPEGIETAGWRLFTCAGTGFGVKSGSAGGAFCILLYFVGKYFPFLTAGGTLDFHFI